MRIRSTLCLTFFLILCVTSSSQAQLRKKNGDVRGNLRLESITIPDDIAREFERLNPQALLYHPVKMKSEKSPLVIFLHGSGGGKRPIERTKWKGEVKRFITPEKGNPIASILVPQSNGLWDPAR